MPHVEKGNTIIAIVIVIVFSAVHMLSALNTVDYYPQEIPAANAELLIALFAYYIW